jgi:Na+-translocating ferredoxin:NAD+ oxidoreductase RnfG subunit
VRRHKISSIILDACLCAGLVFFLGSTAYGFTLLTQEEALREIFGTKATIVEETRELKGEKLAAVKARLGGDLVSYQEGSESARVEEEKNIVFHFAERDGKKYGVAIIDTEPGKWGPVEFIVAMDLKGVVRSVKVLSYQEKRGRPIARSSFMNQYRGKRGSDPVTVGKDITGISGATISSRSASFSVRKAIALYEEFYLKGK